MDNGQHTDTELQRFMDEEMNAAEQDAFKMKLQNNSLLRDELAGLQSARTAIILHAANAQVAAIAKERKAVAPVVRMQPYRRILKYGIAAAACVLLFIAGLLTWNSQPSADTLFAEQYVAYEPVQSRGAEDVLPLEKAYIRHQYAAVISAYKSMAAPAQKEMLLAGNAYLETNQPVKAVQAFNRLLEKNKSIETKIYNDEAMYYLALAHLKAKDYAAAVDLMEAILADTTNAYHKSFSSSFINKVKKLNK